MSSPTGVLYLHILSECLGGWWVRQTLVIEPVGLWLTDTGTLQYLQLSPFSKAPLYSLAEPHPLTLSRVCAIN